MTQLGEVMRSRREELGLSQVRAADRGGLDPSTWNQIETGARRPSSPTLEKIALALALEMSDLFRGYEIPLRQAPLPFNAVGIDPRHYPYPWMSDTLDQVMGVWDRAVESRIDPVGSYMIMNAALDVLGSVLRYDMPGGTLQERAPKHEVLERAAVADRLWNLVNRAQAHYEESKEAEAAAANELPNLNERLQQTGQQITKMKESA